MSALEQDPPPLEVLVCDDGSSDAARAQLMRLEAEQPRVRYLRCETNHGTPGPARNLGISGAAGDWIGFLDDDDRWLPGKLAAQVPYLDGDRYDLVASNAVRANGSHYFGAVGGTWCPSRSDLETANPVIVSSAVVRRSCLLNAGCFDRQRWLKSVADYSMWLRLADRHARFVILALPLVYYEDAESGRLSAADIDTQWSLTRLHWQRWLAAPRDGDLARAALREAYSTLRAAIGAARRVVVPRSGGRAPS